MKNHFQNKSEDNNFKHLINLYMGLNSKDNLIGSARFENNCNIFTFLKLLKSSHHRGI